MIAPETRFYQTGGNLERDAPSYIERQADRDLFDALCRGEFCYVLDSRQMGKSSLMVRTAARLRAAGCRVAALDLTALGQNLSPEQWYLGLLLHLGRALDLEDELDDFWEAHERLGPLQRWMAALREVVLPRVGVGGWASGVGEGDDPPAANPQPPTPNASKLVLFLDEIDAVRSLAFSTDEFFAAIRECYNRRTQEPEFHRLTFCLLGVATPSDLIRDTRTTPFNIGRRIELTDFTEAEALPLATGLDGGTGRRGDGASRRVLARVLHWTGGHPYLTQRLCRAVAEAWTASDTSASPVSPSPRLLVSPSPAAVDRLCAELFLSPHGREQDDNLVFVRERLLRALTPEGTAVDRAALLELYGQVRGGRRVAADRANPLVEILRLSGIVRHAASPFRSSGHQVIRSSAALQVRNRIYEQVFDRAWVTQHMPDAELRRQQAAFRRGLLRAMAVSGVILAVVMALALTAVQNARRAEAGQRALRRNLYVASMNLAQQALETMNLGRAQALLKEQRPGPDQEDLRGFEWRYLWRHARSDERFTWQGHAGRISTVAFSPDGRLLASAGYDKKVKLWEVSTRREVTALDCRGTPDSLAFSSAARLLVTLNDDGVLKLWAGGAEGALWGPGPGATWRERAAPVGCARSAAFTRDGRTLAIDGVDGTFRLWDVATWREVARIRENKRDWLGGALLSPDGKMAAVASGGSTVTLWDVSTQQKLGSLPAHGQWIDPVAFSPDGKSLVVRCENASIELWDVAPAQRAGTGEPQRGAGPAPGRRRVPGAGCPPKVGVARWGLALGGPPKVGERAVALFKGHQAAVEAVAFSPNGRVLASGSDDNTIRLWDAVTKQAIAVLQGHTAPVNGVAFSPDGHTLASGDAGGSLKLWDTPRKQEAEKREIDTLTWPAASPTSVAFSPDDKTLAAGSPTGGVRIWNMATGRGPATLKLAAGVLSVAFSPNGRTLAAGGSGGVTLWDTATWHGMSAWSDPHDYVTSVAFSPDGRLLAIGRSDLNGPHRPGKITLWDMVRRRTVRTLPGHTGRVISVAFSPEGRRLASGSADDTVKLWDVGTGRMIALLPGHQGWIGGVAFSPDGQLLASGSQDRTVKLWDTRTKRELATWRGHKAAVRTVAFCADGKTLATGSSDATVKLWNLATGREAATFNLHPAAVMSVAFSNDGRILAAGRADGLVRLWRAAGFAETDGPASARSSSVREGQRR